jgi:protein subunit release factor A
VTSRGRVPPYAGPGCAFNQKIRQTGGMKLRPEDLRIDIIRVVGGKPCAVRVVHLPTGTSASAEDEESIAANRELALIRLSDLLGAELPDVGPNTAP